MSCILFHPFFVYMLSSRRNNSKRLDVLLLKYGRKIAAVSLKGIFTVTSEGKVTFEGTVAFLNSFPNMV